MRKALITGSLGQDGSYLAEHLLSIGYEVWGTLRQSVHSVNSKSKYVEGVHYHYADMRDELSLETLIRKCNPDEIYNLAGQVFVPTSWDYPSETLDVNTLGLARLLKIVENVSKAKVYQASSSEMYGNMLSQSHFSLNEQSPMSPVSPYGVSKYAAHKLVDVYRQKGMFVVSGILFNHESPRRGHEMVTRKISRHFAAEKAGYSPWLRLGNVESKRDWGFAGDYVKAMHLMLQQPIPEDFVIGTGKAHSVKEFIDCAKSIVGKTGVIDIDCSEYKRENELHTLVADYSKAKTKLGWEPECSFETLVKMMIEADYEKLEKVHVQRN